MVVEHDSVAAKLVTVGRFAGGDLVRNDVGSYVRLLIAG